MEDITHLYLVTCERQTGNASIDVYVVASDFNEAEKKALKEMTDRSYGYDVCSNCKVLASDGYELKILIL